MSAGGGWRAAGRRLARLPRRTRALAGLAAAALPAAIVLLALLLPRPVDETWEAILAGRVLRVCTDPSWPPFEAIDEPTGEVRGLDADLAGALAARLAPGVPLRAEMVPVGFDSLYDALLAGRCDAVLSALPVERERTRDVAYSPAYFNAGQVIVVRDGAAGIESVADLAGRRVGVEWGWVAEGEPRQRGLLQALPVRRFETADAALRALQAGEIDAALVDHVSALAYGHECGGVRLAGEPLSTVSYAIPVRPDAFRLLEEIERVLGEMDRDGTLDALVDRWF